MLSRPDHIREVFGGSPAVMHAGEGNTALEPVMGSSSLLLLDDEDHVRMRRQLMPAFSGQALRGYAEMVHELAVAEVETWPTGTPFQMHERMRNLTLEIILQVIFGVTDHQRLNTLRPLVDKIVSVSPIIMLGGFYRPLLRIPPWRTFLRAQDAIDQLLYDEIARRRGNLAGRNDVLSRLLAAGEWTDVELRDQLVTLLLAGHETTATALAWAFHELARRPEDLAFGQHAADHGADGELEAIVEGVAAVASGGLPGRSSADRDRRIWRATDCREARRSWRRWVWSIATTNTSRTPEEFRPQRFLSDDPPAPGTWIPFGGGARRCIGAGFSLMEATEILRATLAAYNLHARNPVPEPAQAKNVTLIPKHGTRVTVTPR